MWLPPTFMVVNCVVPTGLSVRGVAPTTSSSPFKRTMSSNVRNVLLATTNSALLYRAPNATAGSNAVTRSQRKIQTRFLNILYCDLMICDVIFLLVKHIMRDDGNIDNFMLETTWVILVCYYYCCCNTTSR
jgi:hypothetical protein